MPLTIFKRRARMVASTGILAAAGVTIFTLIQVGRNKMTSIEASAFWELAIMAIVMAVTVCFIVLVVIHERDGTEVEQEPESG